jgi:hypothetical protein
MRVSERHQFARRYVDAIHHSRFELKASRRLNHSEVRCVTILLCDLQRYPGTVISGFRFCVSIFVHIYELVRMQHVAIAWVVDHVPMHCEGLLSECWLEHIVLLWPEVYHPSTGSMAWINTDSKRDTRYTGTIDRVDVASWKILDPPIAYDLENAYFRGVPLHTSNVNIYERHFRQDVTIVDLNGRSVTSKIVKVNNP